MAKSNHCTLGAMLVVLATVACVILAEPTKRLEIGIASAGTAVGVLAALAAVLALRESARQHGESAAAQRRGNVIALLISLEDESMTTARKRLAKYLDGEHGELSTGTEDYECAIVVLNRLEDAAALIAQQVVDGETMRASLHGWVHRYWTGLSPALPQDKREYYEALSRLAKEWGPYPAKS